MLRLAQTHPTIERLAIQAVCEILNRFHFEVGQEKYRPQHWKEDVKRWTGAVAGACDMLCVCLLRVVLWVYCVGVCVLCV